MLGDRLCPLLALAVMLVTGGCGGPDDESVAHRPGAGGWRTYGCQLAAADGVAAGRRVVPGTPAVLHAVAARIDQAGRRDFRASYAGLEVDEQFVRAVVYRVPSAAFDDFLRQAAGNTCLLVRDAPYSTADLAGWHDRVLADLPFWADRGIRILTIGARHDGAGVEIGTADPGQAQPALTARYGANAPLVFVAQGPVRPLRSADGTG